MNVHENKLTLQETEQLCECFMDCKLSVIGENELRYVLCHVDHHSPLIDSVRSLMGIELAVFDRSTPTVPRIRTRLWTKKASRVSIAASIAVLACIGVSVFHPAPSGREDSAPEYIAFANGRQLGKEAAKKQVEADVILADNFLKEMAEQEAREKAMIDDFFNNQTR
ncbi:MAG: hypothetical protein HDS11_03375 [Bacteroides sp.]|nr:hypothetical protein [Bacteroides sp.]